jgi:hypothetical protein
MNREVMELMRQLDSFKMSDDAWTQAKRKLIAKDKEPKALDEIRRQIERKIAVCQIDFQFFKNTPDTKNVKTDLQRAAKAI